MLDLFSLISLKMHFSFLEHWHEVEDKELTKGSNHQNSELYAKQSVPRVK